MSTPQYRLVNRKVLLHNPQTEETTTNTGITLLKSRDEGKIRTSQIVLTAPDCYEVAVGDTVIFNTALEETTDDGKYIVVSEDDIMLIVCK